MIGSVHQPWCWKPGTAIGVKPSTMLKSSPEPWVTILQCYLYVRYTHPPICLNWCSFYLRLSRKSLNLSQMSATFMLFKIVYSNISLEFHQTTSMYNAESSGDVFEFHMSLFVVVANQRRFSSPLRIWANNPWNLWFPDFVALSICDQWRYGHGWNFGENIFEIWGKDV